TDLGIPHIDDLRLLSQSVALLKVSGHRPGEVVSAHRRELAEIDEVAGHDLIHLDETESRRESHLRVAVTVHHRGIRKMGEEDLKVPEMGRRFEYPGAAAATTVL